MSAAACKASRCTSCLTNVHNEQTVEFLMVISNLAANNHFNDDELEEIIKKATRFLAAIEEQLEMEAELAERRLKIELRIIESLEHLTSL